MNKKSSGRSVPPCTCSAVLVAMAEWERRWALISQEKAEAEANAQDAWSDAADSAQQVLNLIVERDKLAADVREWQEISRKAMLDRGLALIQRDARAGDYGPRTRWAVQNLQGWWWTGHDWNPEASFAVLFPSREGARSSLTLSGVHFTMRIDEFAFVPRTFRVRKKKT